MESLNEDIWDVIISGTGLQQSLLALSLSRSNKKILHLDRNDWYGGIDAGLSLNDVDTWIKDIREGRSCHFSDPQITTPEPSNTEGVPPLGPSRSYTLPLRPQIIYAKSAFLPALVSSKIAPQLEFVAVGSTWTLGVGGPRKIPSTREEVFSDDSLSVRDKRSLMKFLRFVLQEDQEFANSSTSDHDMTLERLLETFKIPVPLHSAVQALSLSTTQVENTNGDIAVQHIRRHLQSIGHLGPGFGAVVAKYGSNPEIAQVACRAQAVGGGIYLLGHGLDSVAQVASPDTSSDTTGGTMLEVILSDGTKVRARRVVGGHDDLPTGLGHTSTDSDSLRALHSISLVSKPLDMLFTSSTESGPTPAVVVVLVEPENGGENPIYLQVHSEDTGECPHGQSIIYASAPRNDGLNAEMLSAAVQDLLAHVNQHDKYASTTGDLAGADVLWSLSYTSSGVQNEATMKQSAERETQLSGVTCLPPTGYSLAVDDTILDTVRVIWRDITNGEIDDEQFLRFEDREAEASNDNEQ